jgi:hypothetical protein
MLLEEMWPVTEQRWKNHEVCKTDPVAMHTAGSILEGISPHTRCVKDYDSTVRYDDSVTHSK